MSNIVSPHNEFLSQHNPYKINSDTTFSDSMNLSNDPLSPRKIRSITNFGKADLEGNAEETKRMSIGTPLLTSCSFEERVPCRIVDITESPHIPSDNI